MSAWNGVLQALHSALIDELNESFPEEKPELGLPARIAGWGLSAQAQTALVAKVSVDGQAGVAALGSLSSQKETELKELFARVVKRADSDFQRRGISPVFDSQPAYGADGRLPAGFSSPSMVIWLPISLDTKKERFVFDLGVGV